MKDKILEAIGRISAIFMSKAPEVVMPTEELEKVAADLEAEMEEERKKRQRVADAGEMLWVVLANVSGGDWEKQTPEWQEAAQRWRDNWFNVLGKNNT